MDLKDNITNKLNDHVKYDINIKEKENNDMLFNINTNFNIENKKIFFEKV
jgi:hypothetical protein